MWKMDLSIGQPNLEFDTNILAVDVPAELDNAISTGHEYIDLLFAGDGILPSTCALITGVPGAGKTTLMIQLADQITRTHGACLYNTGEESLYQVRRVTKRLRLSHGFVPGYDRDVKKITDHAEKLRGSSNEPIVLIVDSLQCLEVEREEGKRGRNLSKANMEVAAVEYLTRWAKETYNIVLIIGQVNKNGELAGKQALKHIVDCHMHMDYDKDRKSTSYGQRICEMTKNRFGTAGVYYCFDIEERGIMFERQPGMSV